MSATGVSVGYTPSVLQLCVYVFERKTSSVSSGTGLHDPGTQNLNDLNDERTEYLINDGLSLYTFP